MKKSTLILVLIAAALGGFVYWREFKRAPKKSAKASPPIFHFQPSDVASIRFVQPGGTIVVERHGSGWQIAQPVETRANKNVIQSLLDDATLAHASRTLTPTGDQLSQFGLASPAVTLSFHLNNGQTHQIELGSADYSGTSAYARVDGSKQVILAPDSLLQDGTKTIAQLRDNSVLGITDLDVQSFALDTPSTRVEAVRSAKNDSVWRIQKPTPMLGDSTSISQLLDNVSGARLTKVVSESASDLARYGLVHPPIAFRVHLASGSDRTLEIGGKQGPDYFARDTSRNMIFLVPASLEKQLDLSLFSLRDKRLLHGLPDAFTRVDYTGPSFHFVCGVNGKGDWVMFQPAADKGKTVANWKVFDPLTSASANQILDHAPVSLMAQVAHPAIEITLTRKDGAKKIYRFSKPVGDQVYVWVSNGSGLYRVSKDTYDSLIFKTPGDIVR